MVVDMWPASTMSAIRILKNCGGPCDEDWPREVENRDDPSTADPIPALIASVPGSGSASIPGGGPAAFKSSEDFFFFKTMRDLRR